MLDLENPRGNLVGTTLSMMDLFSFDVLGGSQFRANLEELFKKYEDNIVTYTQNLLDKSATRSHDIETEVIGIFTAKLMNFLRNPFCIQKVLNSFPALLQCEPTDPELLNVYRHIIDGQKPHLAHLCCQLGISPENYIQWLKIIFVLLMPIQHNRSNLFEELSKKLFEDRNTQATVMIWTYDQDVCLLSDRSFCQRLPDGPHTTMSFNLCSTAFIDYVFSDPMALIENANAPVLNAWRARPQNTIEISVIKNNHKMLARFNRRTIEQARERVYCAKSDGILII